MKRITAFSLVGLLLLSCAACGKKKPAPTDGQDSSSQNNAHQEETVSLAEGVDAISAADIFDETKAQEYEFDPKTGEFVPVPQTETGSDEQMAGNQSTDDQSTVSIVVDIDEGSSVSMEGWSPWQ